MAGRRPSPRATALAFRQIKFDAVAADRRQTKSKYTADRMIPGAYDGETVTRRRLMVIGANGAGAVAAAAFLLPALGFALGPVFEAHPRPWVNVGPVEDFP